MAVGAPVEYLSGMIKAVFFDVGGVLLHQDPAIFELLDRDCGWPTGTSRDQWRAYLNIALLDSSVAPSDIGEAVVRIKERLYSSNRVREGMENLVQELQSHYRLAVISNFTSDLDQVLSELG